jgi:hypothetical protein
MKYGIVCVCVYIYIYRHTHRESTMDRELNREITSQWGIVAPRQNIVEWVGSFPVYKHGNVRNN